MTDLGIDFKMTGDPGIDHYALVVTHHSGQIAGFMEYLEDVGINIQLVEVVTLALFGTPESVPVTSARKGKQGRKKRTGRVAPKLTKLP